MQSTSWRSMEVVTSEPRSFSRLYGSYSLGLTVLRAWLLARVGRAPQPSVSSPKELVAHALLLVYRVSVERYLRGELAAAEMLSLDSLDMARLAKLGISCLDAKLIDQARAIFRLMARLRPDSYLVHLYLGIVADTEDDLLTAKEAYERAGTLLEAGELSPERRGTLLEVVLLLACVLIRLARTEDAVAYLTALRASGEPEVQLEAQELLMTIDAGRAQS